LAQANRTRIILEAEAEAETLRLKGEAESFAIQAKAKADAEQAMKKAEAWKEYKKAAIINMVLETLPKVIYKKICTIVKLISYKYFIILI